MAYPISRIRNRVIRLFCIVTAAAIAVLMLLTPIISDLAPQAAGNERLNYLIFGPLLLVGMVTALNVYLRPISDLGYAIEIGSTPAGELAQHARRIALDAPIYFFVFPIAGAFLISLVSNVFGMLFLPGYSFQDHVSSTLLVTATAACGSLAVSLVSRKFLRPVLLITSAHSQVSGLRLTVRTRLSTGVLILTLVAYLFTGLFGFHQVVKAHREQIADTALLRLSGALDSMPPRLASGEILDHVLEALGGAAGYEYVFLLNDEGQILDQRGKEDGALVFRGERWLPDCPDKLRAGRAVLMFAPVQGTEQGRWIGIGTVLKPFGSAQVVRTAAALAISGICLLALAVAVSRCLATDVTLDLYDATARLEDMAQGEPVDLNTPLPVLAMDEVGDLVQAYNALQQRVHAQQEQLEHKQRQLVALQELSYKIGTLRNVDHLLQEVVRDVERSLGYHNVSILLADAARNDLYFAAADYPDSAFRYRRFRIGEDGVVGRAAGSGTPLIINDVAKCDFYIPDKTETRSELAVPLIVGDRVIGVFNVSSERIGAFGEDDVRIISALGNQIAIAIENTRLLDAAMARADKSQRGHHTAQTEYAGELQESGL